MNRVSVLFCLVSVAFAHPYDTSGYVNNWIAGQTPIQYSNGQLYSQPRIQVEGSSRLSRVNEYPSTDFENDQAVPQVRYLELDENTARNIRSIVSGQSMNSNMQYESNLNQQIPHVSSVTYTSPEMEHSSPDYRSFSYDTIPYTTNVDNPIFNMPASVNARVSSGEVLDLKNYLLKELSEPIIKHVTDSKRPRMIGFYYMNIQRFPFKQLTDDSVFDPKPIKNQGVEELDGEKMNEDEMLRQLQHLLRQQISKFMHHQQQEHSLFQELTEPQNIKQTSSEESSYNKVDLHLMAKEEKKFLVERLQQEERWLEDSLKHIRDFMNELQTKDDNVANNTSTSATPAVASDLNDANDGVRGLSTSTEGFDQSTTTSTASANLNGSPPEETA